MYAEDLKVMDPEGTVTSPDDLEISAQGQILSKFMAAILVKRYWGWNWGITVDERGGVVHVFNLDLSGDLGYTLLLDDLYNGGNFDWKMVMLAGGEILERYGLPRTAKAPDWKGHVTWSNGIPVPDMSDKHEGLIKHFAKRAGS